MDRIPIVCTLEGDDVPSRLAEWRRFLERDCEGVERAPGTAILTLRDDGEIVARAADLARREQGCCGFLTFTLRLDGSGATLRIDTPDGAEAVLDALVTA